MPQPPRKPRPPRPGDDRNRDNRGNFNRNDRPDNRGNDRRDDRPRDNRFEGNRENRGDRPQSDRPQGGGGFRDRPQGGRPFGDRPPSGGFRDRQDGRGERDNRERPGGYNRDGGPNRGANFGNDRPNRGFGNRDGNRFGDRNERSDRPARDFGNRDNRGNDNRDNRDNRGERPNNRGNGGYQGERGPNFGREFRPERSDRGERPANDSRPERSERSDRGERPRYEQERPRPEREPRPEPRPEPVGEAGEREERGEAVRGGPEREARVVRVRPAGTTSRIVRPVSRDRDRDRGGDRPQFAQPDTRRVLNRLLIRAVTEDDKETIPVLLKLGADPNAQNASRIPALVVAMEQAVQGKATSATVRVLLDGGANPNFLIRPEFVRGSDFWFGYATESTPLGATVSRAALPGFEDAQLQIVRMLLQRGADPALADNDGETPLARAEALDEAEPTRRELQDIVNLLKNAGAQ